MKAGYHAIIVTVLLAMMLGCAKPSVQEWHSIPSSQRVSNQFFEATITPVKENAAYFVGFRLTVENKTNAAMAIDWNATRYRQQGKDLGVLVFAGIDPETIQGAIPADTVAAGETFTRIIFPYRTIAFLPRAQRPEAGKRGFMAGVLPAGENSVVLVLRQNQQQWQPTLSVRLIAESLPAKP